MAHSTMLHVRVDDEIKTQASEALAAMGSIFQFRYEPEARSD